VKCFTTESFNMMFSTTLAALTVSGLMANANLVPPTFVTDYSKALTISAEQSKPIAVFITAGGSSHLLKDEGMGSESIKLLRDSFVPMHVDTTTAKGAELAKTFDMKEGLVISDRSGHLQALRHGGTVTPTALQEYLAKFSATTKVATTEYQGLGAAPAAATIPAYSVPYYGARSSCPNCR
jgi:hypothetical protein